MDIFNFDDYRPYIQFHVRQQKGARRGMYTKIAQALDMHTTNVSKVIQGHKSLTPEQAAALAEFFALNALETEYLLALVYFERAGTPPLRKNCAARLRQLREASAKLSERLPSDRQLSEEAKSIFYSNWYYSALSLATDIEGLNSVESLATHFSLPRAKVKDVMQFLIAQNICAEENGKLRMSSQHMHLDSQSPYSRHHHTDWRLKAIERTARELSDNELQYTAPITLSRADALRLRKLLIHTIEEALAIVNPSVSEEVFCLNIDLFNVD